MQQPWLLACKDKAGERRANLGLAALLRRIHENTCTKLKLSGPLNASFLKSFEGPLPATTGKQIPNLLSAFRFQNRLVFCCKSSARRAYSKNFAFSGYSPEFFLIRINSTTKLRVTDKRDREFFKAKNRFEKCQIRCFAEATFLRKPWHKTCRF